jgi:hypothetical protein
MLPNPSVGMGRRTRSEKRSFDETGLNRLIGETLRVAEEQRRDREAAISSAIRSA